MGVWSRRRRYGVMRSSGERARSWAPRNLHFRLSSDPGCWYVLGIHPVLEPSVKSYRGSAGLSRRSGNTLISDMICARDAAGQAETKETQKTTADSAPPVCRAQYAEQGRPETAETHVVWLITQRSRVQIPRPLPRPEALSRTEKGPSACGL